jgi:ribonuclease P protein component
LQPHIISKGAKNGYGLPKQMRLLRSVDYRKVYNEGRRRSLDFLVAFAMANGRSLSRIGFTVPRAVGGSVERNRVKRRLRESTRKHLAELGPGWDIVFNVRQSAKRVEFATIEHAVRRFFLSCARDSNFSLSAPGSDQEAIPLQPGRLKS